MTLSASDYTPTGTVLTASDVYMEGGPEFWLGGVPKYSPDTDGFYWGLTGTVANPLYKIGCYTDFRFRDNIQMQEVRCDTVGVIATIQKRAFLELSFTLHTLLPLAQMRYFMRGAAVTTNLAEHAEKMGLGDINNNLFWPVFLSRVYDQDAGDWFSITGHRAQIVDVWEIAMTFGMPWQMGVKMRLNADLTKPATQRFATIVRYDPSLL